MRHFSARSFCKSGVLFGLSALMLSCLTAARSASRDIDTGGKADYTLARSMEHLLHWKKMPIRVYFVPTEAATVERRRQTLAGFDEWVQATEGGIRYSVVEASQQADVSVTIDTDAAIPGEHGAVGNTRVVFTHTEIESATMELAAGETTPNQLQEVAAHEFGHALGIDGHSDDPDDLMAPTEIRRIDAYGSSIDAPAHAVTRRDLNTLRACYGSLLAAPSISSMTSRNSDPDSETIGPADQPH